MKPRGPGVCGRLSHADVFDLYLRGKSFREIALLACSSSNVERAISCERARRKIRYSSREMVAIEWAIRSADMRWAASNRDLIEQIQIATAEDGVIRRNIRQIARQLAGSLILDASGITKPARADEIVGEA